MDIQKHQRINQIKRLSRWLYRGLNFVQLGLCLGWAGLAYVALQTEGVLEVGGFSLELSHLEVSSRVSILIVFVLSLALLHLLTHHLRRLMLCFSQGDVFNAQALACVRKALNTGVMIFVLSLLQHGVGFLLNPSPAVLFDFSFTTESLVAVVFFGLMFCLMWTLEIGSDLHEESDLTI